jgi:hypothetical protein
MPSIENLNTAKSSADQEIAAQVTTASALDARLMGLLAFMAAVDTVLLTAKDGLASSRWILLVGASVASVLALLGIGVGADLKAGPSANKFYEKYRDKAPEEYVAQLLADLGKTIEGNRQGIDLRRGLLTAAFFWAVVASIAFGLVRWVN